MVKYRLFESLSIKFRIAEQSIIIIRFYKHTHQPDSVKYQKENPEYFRKDLDILTYKII